MIVNRFATAGPHDGVSRPGERTVAQAGLTKSIWNLEGIESIVGNHPELLLEARTRRVLQALCRKRSINMIRKLADRRIPPLFAQARTRRPASGRTSAISRRARPPRSTSARSRCFKRAGWPMPSTAIEWAHWKDDVLSVKYRGGDAFNYFVPESIYTI